MRRVWIAAAVAGVWAAPLSAAPAPASSALSGDVARAAAAAAAAARAANVTGVSVVPSAGRAEVVVAVSGAVEVADFTLSAPHRVVLDIKGASLAPGARGGAAYDRVARGPVSNVRLAQFRAGVVRVVIDLADARSYTVTREDGQVRVSVDGAANFAAWHSGAARPAAATATVGGARVESLAAASAPVAAAAPAARRGAPAPAPAPEPAAPARLFFTSNAEPLAPTPRAQQRSQQPRITVTYQDADIRDVLAAFAAFSGRTIVVGREINGTVTAEIRDQPWDVALNAILQAQGLAAAEDVNGIITVDSYTNILAKQASEPLVTRLISVNYVNAGSLAQTVERLLSRDCAQGGGGAGAAGGAAGAGQGGGGCLVRGSVAADSATNSLLVTEVPSRINSLIGYIRELDVRTPQVAIKAKIIFVNRTNLEDIGLTYDLGRGTDQFFGQLVQRTDPSTRTPVDTDGDGVPDALGGGTPFAGDRILLGGRAFSAIANANNRVPRAALNLIYSASIGRYQLTTFLDALREVQLADVQAEPNIVTLDNRRAEILVGQEVALRTIDAGTAGGAGGGGGGGGGGATGGVRATVQLKEVGIILAVTPHITNNRQILMQLHAENSDAQLASSDVGLIFNKQRADNQILVADGETAVVGGLTVTTVSKVRTGIPILIDLPFIGRLFGRTSTTEAKRDLLILVTPHIIDEGERADRGNNR